MDCPKCGGNMEKGVIFLYPHSIYDALCPHLEWYSDKSIKKYEKSVKQLFAKPDCKIFGEINYIGDCRLEAYRCKNCGAVLIIPQKNDKK